MPNMMRLIQNEAVKLRKKGGFWIPIAFLVVLSAGVTFMFQKFLMDSVQMESGIVYLAGMLGATGMAQLIAILVVVAASGIVAQEHAQGTIKFLLIRSRSRGEILTAKYLTIILYTLMLMTIAAVTLFFAGGIAFGFGGTGEQWLNVLRQATYGFVYSIVYATLAFMVGVLTRSASAAIGAGLAGTIFGGIMISKEFYKYVLFPNTDLSVYERIGPPLPGMSLSFSLTMLTVYMVLFLLAGYTVFRRRDVA